ncbi:nuclear transport factor 2 family protein [Flavobacterium sp.]|uniref:nuclear transport factor 2 family protein n=1 Tax=Flavobacterium sp. TaxID=239 RepID=UPI002601E91F|nr:nuclear transport factor 2 family protein [Flavobacterium sp.]
MKTIALLLLGILLTSCGEKSKANENSKNEKLVKTYFEHFNNHDWIKMAEMYTETADFKDPSLGSGVVKQAQMQTIAKYTALNKIFPDLKDEVKTVYPSGENHIIVEFISTGTAPDNTKFELPICTIFTIENGKITKDFTYYDNFEE